MNRVGKIGLLLAAALWAWSAARGAEGQSSSLYGDPAKRGPMTLATCSPFYDPAPLPKQFRKHDLITVVVNQQSQVVSEGEMDRRKKASLDMVLKDWVVLKGWSVRPDPQSEGSPKIAGEMNNKYRAESELETRSAMKFNIAARVVDIRPNGNLILEGRRWIANNDEVWEFAITGEVRPKDVLDNNTVLSENVADLWIEKRERGHVRDGYRRGFVTKFIDRYQPF